MKPRHFYQEQCVLVLFMLQMLHWADNVYEWVAREWRRTVTEFSVKRLPSSSSPGTDVIFQVTWRHRIKGASSQACYLSYSEIYARQSELTLRQWLEASITQVDHRALATRPH